MNPSPIHRFSFIVLLLSSFLLIIPLSAADVADTSVSGESWRVLPIRSQEEFNLGLTGGEAEQHFHGMARSLYNPSYIYLSQDVAGPWKSIDSGETWAKTLDDGLFVNDGESIEVDPADEQTVFVIEHGNWLNENAQGLYRSTDGGDSWSLVLQKDTNYDSSLHRMYAHNIAYDLASATTSTPAARWYVAFHNDGLYRSDDGGVTWSTTPVSSLSGHATVYSVLTHPTDGKTVYVATSSGLYRSTARGASLAKIGNLPSGAVSSIQINPQNPLVIYATVKGTGLYRSTDGGTTFSLLKSFGAARVFINPGHPEVIYLVAVSSPNAIVSHDAGATWITDMTVTGAPGRESGWKGAMTGELTGIMPDPANADEAVAYTHASIFKTTDGGQTFTDHSTLFTGFAWSWWNTGIAFDRFSTDRFATFNNDVAAHITNNGGDYFEDDTTTDIWSWYTSGKIEWIGAYSGDIQPVAGSKVMVASIGGYWNKRLMRTADGGVSWTLLEGTAGEVENNYFIGFNPDHPEIVYAGNKISRDAGLTFSKINFGTLDSGASVLGMCRAQPDTIYAMNPARTQIYRSDNQGATWRLYTSPGWQFRKLDSVPTFTADPVDPDKIYTIDSRGDVAIFDGTGWTHTGVIDKAGTGYNNFVRTIAVDPRHPEIIYAGMMAGGISCIWRSTDGGATWEDITLNLPRDGMSAMAVSPLTGELFKGSCMGTWIFPPPYAGDTPAYDKATVRPFDTDAGAGQIQALPEMSALPTDPDRDGIYEDLNGNGRKDFDDVVLFFKQLDWIAANEPVSAFDPNGNGRADFDDIVRIFEEL
jgi:PKD repeat protein